MRVALLISGYLRTFKDNISNIENNIINKFKSVDVYIHITKDEDKYDKYLNNFDLYEDIEYIQKKINPLCLLVESNIDYKTENKFHYNIINNWIKYYKLNFIKKTNEKVYGKYDLVIKYRPDLNIEDSKIFPENIINDIIYLPRDSKIDKKKIKNNNKYICDVFAFGSSDIMDKYFNIFENYQNLLQYDDIPETILYHYLTNNFINYELLDIKYQITLSKCNIFGICGDSGSGKTTLGNVLKQFFSNSFMLECDRYHKWERGSEKWDTLTHLNPEANYIAKMNEDIFNLKIGNSIYQVDYDHQTGKFTQEELIEPCENTIVCGLHSLYTQNEQLYDLKIYIDTGEDLKKEWKIKRDSKERGHSIEYINKQIDKRKEDYINYIYPQREKSDLIINFFSKYDDTKDVYLKLLVNKKYDTRKIINTLNFKNIGYNLSSEEDKFISFTFKEYKNINLWDNESIPIFNNFYDYIIFFIFNLKGKKI